VSVCCVSKFSSLEPPETQSPSIEKEMRKERKEQRYGTNNPVFSKRHLAELGRCTAIPRTDRKKAKTEELKRKRAKTVMRKEKRGKIKSNSKPVPIRTQDQRWSTIRSCGKSLKAGLVILPTIRNPGGVLVVDSGLHTVWFCKPFVTVRRISPPKAVVSTSAKKKGTPRHLKTHQGS